MVRIWAYLTFVVLLTFAGNRVGTELWDREWESTDQSGDPELGSLYQFGGIVGGFTLAIVLVFAHSATRNFKGRRARR